jgi:hypothetical protein
MGCFTAVSSIRASAAASSGFKYRNGAGYGDPADPDNNGWELNAEFIKNLSKNFIEIRIINNYFQPENYLKPLKKFEENYYFRNSNKFSF